MMGHKTCFFSEKYGQLPLLTRSTEDICVPVRISYITRWKGGRGCIPVAKGEIPQRLKIRAVIRGGIEDISKIIFPISQQKHML